MRVSTISFRSLSVGKLSNQQVLPRRARKLMILLKSPFPSDLQAQRLSVPNPFSRLDLTQKDVLTLGESFVRRFPDRAQPILLVGLRTSGSYFVPLLRAFFEAEGYKSVALLTIYPNHGLGRREKRELERFAARGYWALIVDDPPETSRTVLTASDIARRAGFAPGSVKFLPPTHPASTKLVQDASRAKRHHAAARAMA